MGQIKNVQDYKKAALEAAEIYNKKDYKNALVKFQELAKVNSKNYKIHETLSFIHLNLNNVDMAEKEYQLALKIARQNNQNMHSPKTFEELVSDVGDLETAETEYNRIMNEEPHQETMASSRPAIHLGILYMAQGEYKKAEEILMRYKQRYEAITA